MFLRLYYTIGIIKKKKYNVNRLKYKMKLYMFYFFPLKSYHILFILYSNLFKYVFVVTYNHERQKVFHFT